MRRPKCAIPDEIRDLLADVKSLGDVAQRSAEASVSGAECTPSFVLAGPPTFFLGAPLACGAMKIMIGDSVKAAKCTVAAAKDGSLQKLMFGDKSPVTYDLGQACQLAGAVTLKVARNVLTKKVPAGTPARQLLDVVAKGQDAATKIQRLAHLAECQ